MKLERELAETRKNEGLDQISSDHPVRKLISKFRKISQENRTTPPNNPSSSTPPNTVATPPKRASLSTLSPPMIIEPEELTPDPNVPAAAGSTGKTRDKLETISERIETQESRTSQITSVNQSPPLHRPPKSSKWKWLKTGSTGPETDSPPIGAVTSLKSSVPQQSTNPFDSNITADDDRAADGKERRPSIPLSLFVPREAQRDNLRAPEDVHDDQVSEM